MPYPYDRATEPGLPSFPYSGTSGIPVSGSNVGLTPSALTGDITITASSAIWSTDHVGALIRIASNTQTVSEAITAENVFSDPIRVTGVDAGRTFGIVISGTFTATITVQYSVGEIGSWVDLATTYTAPISTTYLDEQNNQIIYYRIGIKTGDFTSASGLTCALNFTAGSITGLAKITGFTSTTVVTASVIVDFGSTDASTDWWEGAWSAHRGFPSAVALHEGRLWWAGQDRIWGSVSDGYEDFDDLFIGDAGPISRSIGFGPIQRIHWLMSTKRMMMGTAMNSAKVDACKIQGNSLLDVRSSSYDEPLTPSNFNIRTTDVKGIYVDRSRQRLYQDIYDAAKLESVSQDLSIFAPDYNEVGIVRIAVQMKPDVRVHCVRSDGTVGVLVFDQAENVICWVGVETDGTVEDVCVLPGEVEDQVYYSINRTNGRTIEKWALESECQGGLLNKQADSFVVYDSTPATSITGLTHLEGETVVVWADGADVGTHTVASGAITLSVAASKVVVGLGYTAQFKGTKLATLNVRGGAGLNEEKKVVALGLVLKNTHYQAITYGPDFSTLYDLPAVEGGQVTAANTVWSNYEGDVFTFGGSWDTDSRICLQAAAPRPCTILAATAKVESL